jgi:hypothetical protein
MSSYMEKRRNEMLNGKPPVEKKRYSIPKKSAKKMASEKAERDERGGKETEMQLWFIERRKEMTGKCKCGCGRPSQKKDDDTFSFSICHIFPKNKFGSVKTHALNFIELAFIGGCHSNMDNRSIDLWPNMACWPEIKQKVLMMDKVLTKEEKATKFYQKLIGLTEKF